VKRLIQSPFVRGMAIVALVSIVIVALSLQASLVTAGALLSVAFFLAVAFFLFLLWRERRGDLEAWSLLSLRTFYSAIALIVVAIGVYIGLGADGPESVVFVCVVGACAYAIVRVWRREHRYR
jgi:predicted transporter